MSQWCVRVFVWGIIPQGAWMSCLWHIIHHRHVYFDDDDYEDDDDDDADDEDEAGEFGAGEYGDDNDDRESDALNWHSKASRLHRCPPTTETNLVW